MLIHADFARRVAVTTEQYQWVASPQTGVARVMLDRIGQEQARATSLVRYAAGSSFPSHRHPAGEEILVLSGTFSEGDAHYPAGWYLRNPPGSQHQPGSREGALIFVKLRQMSEHETQPVRINTRDPVHWQEAAGRALGLRVCPLFASDDEQVSLQRLPPCGVLPIASAGGAELLVLAGAITLAGEPRSYPKGSWLRLPAGDAPGLTAGAHGATVYLKTGHLAAMTAC